MLVLRCSKHPAYAGEEVPGFPATREKPAEEVGHQNCPDCWEMYRRVHEQPWIEVQ